MVSPIVALPLFALLLAAPPAAAAERHPDADRLLSRATAEKLARDDGWLRLGHWRRVAKGRWRSEVDGPPFFLSARGKTDPAAELEATIEAFFRPPPGGEDELLDAVCRFPARLAFLEARLGLDPAALPPRRCPRRDDFLERVKPASVTLVFSSYYLHNPSAALGHTFLRLNRAENARAGKDAELLDYGVDYAATVDTSNAVLYAVKGVFGLFHGQFNHYAYYYKVRQYGDYESRDLWEYDLALEPAEVSLLAKHLWELGGTWIDYWYLDENCSYHVLAAVEAAAPRLDLLSGAGSFVVLPSDTVRALARTPGLVRAVHYRPSVRTQFEARARGLGAAERRLVATLATDPHAPWPEGLPDRARAAVLDAAADLVDLRHARKLAKGDDPEVSLLRQALLERRAAVPVVSEPLVVPAPAERRPEAGHGSVRAGAGGGATSARGAFHQLEGRLALHDLADPPAGYPPLAQIEFLPTRLRFYPSDRRFELDDFSLVRVGSIAPASRYELKPSWRMRAGATTVRDAGCDGCLAGVAEVGGGLAAVGLLGGLDLVALGETELLGARGLSGIGGAGVRAGIGPSFVARYRVGNAATVLAEGRWRFLPASTPVQTWSVAGTLRFHVRQEVSLALDVRKTPADRELAAAILAYF
jgi:hypothetical protein